MSPSLLKKGKLQDKFQKVAGRIEEPAPDLEGDPAERNDGQESSRVWS
jgi:hypothetical protein